MLCSAHFWAHMFNKKHVDVLVWSLPPPFPHCIYWCIYTERWMGKPSMSPIPAGRRGPRREVEADATNPMETWTKDTAFLSATSHMMWNGKPWKTWWKKKVGCLDKGLIQSALDMTKRCNIQGHFVWPLQLWRAFGNLCRNLSCTMLLEILWELFGTRVLDEVPLICLSAKELLQTCTSAVNLDVRLNIYSPLRLLKPFVVFVKWRVVHVQSLVHECENPMAWDHERHNEMPFPKKCMKKYTVHCCNIILPRNDGTSCSQLQHVTVKPELWLSVNKSNFWRHVKRNHLWCSNFEFQQGLA